MVNVGGRSKGCSTCRRRRVKCDENRPVCRRCERAGLECTGAKDMTFIQGKIVRSRRTVKQDPACPSVGTELIDYLIPPLFVPCSILKENYLEMYVSYSRKYLRRGGLLDLALQGTQLDQVVAANPSTTNSEIFHQAVLSFATLVFGADHRDKNIVNQGYFIRGTALRRLNQSLSDPKCYIRDEIFLSVVALAILECIVPTGPQHYLQHMIGLERLLELRGPGSTYSPKSADIYKGLRHMVLFASLRTKRPSILARPEWKAALRANCTDVEVDEQELWEVLADCTVLISDKDHSRQAEIVSGALELLNRLDMWRIQRENDRNNVPFESGSALDNLETLGAPYIGTHPFSVAYEFSSLPMAAMWMLYNCALIYVFKILNSIQMGIMSSPSNHGVCMEDPSSYVIHERLSALEICRSLPYYLVQKTRLDTEASPIVHWAITTAWMSLARSGSPEGKWILEILSAKGKRAVAPAMWAC